MARHAGSLIPLDFQSRMAERTDIHFRCRSRSTTRRSRCSNLPCRQRSSAAMKNSVHCGAWTINLVSSSGTPPVHPSRNSLPKSLAARIPIVAAPFSAGSRQQQIPPGRANLDSGLFQLGTRVPPEVEAGEMLKDTRKKRPRWALWIAALIAAIAAPIASPPRAAGGQEHHPVVLAIEEG